MLLFVVIPLFGGGILGNPLHILLIAVPLILQTVLIFVIVIWGAKKLRLSHDIDAPAGLIGASNFVECSVIAAKVAACARP